MKLFVASLATETNTFSPVFTDMRDFLDNFYCPPGSHPDTPSLCSAPFIALREHSDRTLDKIEIVEGTAAWAEPGGIVSGEAYMWLRDEILTQLRDALPVDGVVLGLHGAMVAQGFDDCEGDLLSRVRNITGTNAVIGATFDPHCHFTRQCAEALDVAITFKEFPHTDMMDRARELIDIVTLAVKRDVEPQISVFDCRMIDVFPTTGASIRRFVDRISELEREHSNILSISVVHGFLAGDVPELGTKIIVVSDDAALKGSDLARSIGMELYGMRGRTRMDLVSPGEALDKLDSMPGKGPLVLADVWDNPGGGMAGDSTVILKEVMDRRVDAAALASIWDPIAVQFCFAAGLGATIPLRFGAKSGPSLGEPVDATVTVSGLSENGKMRFGGSLARLGRCAAITVGDGILVVLSENRVQAYTPDIFSCVGINPADKDLLVVKSTNHFRAAFSDLSDRILYVDSHPPYPHDPRTTAYRKLDREIWPIVEHPFHDARP